MDYENKYNKAFDEALVIHKCANSQVKEILEQIFPELVESENTRIRKAIISGMTALKEQGKETFAAININDCITWLEKYDQVKDSAISQHENKTCKESDNSLTSEDERIRKVLLNEFIHLQSNGYKFAGLEGEEIITWLEKQKAVEWSEEDNQTLGRIIAFLWFHRKGDTDAICQQEKDINWLKSIHPLKCWKPSIAQLIALHQAIKEVNKGTADVLKGLYQQLKAI